MAISSHFTERLSGIPDGSGCSGHAGSAGELELSRKLLSSFHENSPHHAFTKDAQGRYLSFNRAFSLFYGVPVDTTLPPWNKFVGA